MSNYSLTLSIAFTGFGVLAGNFSPHKVKDPNTNFRNAFNGTSSDGYGVSNALVSIIFSYSGYSNSFNVANEVANPTRTIKRTANTAIILVAILYILVNIAYFAARESTSEDLSKALTDVSPQGHHPRLEADHCQLVL